MYSFGISALPTGKVSADQFHRRNGFIAVRCGNCFNAALISIATSEGRHYREFTESLAQFNKDPHNISVYKMEIEQMWPEPEKARLPDHIDQATRRALLQAESNYQIAGNEEAAGMMYRRTLEVALKGAFPGGPGNLAKHIKQLVRDGHLTESIGEWSDHIREIGNEAVHEEGPLSREDLFAMREFTDAVLRYAISLPMEVELRRAATAPIEVAALARPPH